MIIYGAFGKKELEGEETEISWCLGGEKYVVNNCRNCRISCTISDPVPFIYFSLPLSLFHFSSTKRI